MRPGYLEDQEVDYSLVTFLKEMTVDGLKVLLGIAVVVADVGVILGIGYLMWQWLPTRIILFIVFAVMGLIFLGILKMGLSD